LICRNVYALRARCGQGQPAIKKGGREMKALAYISIVAAIISLAAGIISRIAFIPLNVAPGGLEARAFLLFTNTCLLFAIAFILLQLLNAKR